MGLSESFLAVLGEGAQPSKSGVAIRREDPSGGGSNPLVGQASAQLLPTSQEVGGLVVASSRGALWEGQGLGDWGRGGWPRRCSCPFTVSVSEAALTRTSAIRLPPCLGPETRRGAGGGRQGAGLGGSGRGEPPPRKKVKEESLTPENRPLSQSDPEGMLL